MIFASFTRPARDISLGKHWITQPNSQPSHHKTAASSNIERNHPSTTPSTTIVARLKGGVSLRRDNGLADGSETQTNRENNVGNQQGV